MMLSFTSQGDGLVNIQPDHLQHIVHYVTAGSNSVTEILAEHSVTNFLLHDSGIWSAVLDFLQRCEQTTFDKVVKTNNNQGDLISPSMWIQVLNMAVVTEPSCTSLIANSIGPLVRSMCNDTERFFFKSNKHWKEGIAGFVKLVYYIITDLRAANALLTHEGLLERMVQWNFWGGDRRPDIAKELQVDELATIITRGRRIIKRLVTNAVPRGDRDLLKSIGATPIVSKEYDPSCMVTCVVGEIRHIKSTGVLLESLDIFQPLIKEVDCIDKDVITEMIDLGMNHVHDYDSAVVVAELSRLMLCQEVNSIQVQPSDTRIAFAIRSGLVEMCLGFIERFGGHVDVDSLYWNIESTFYMVQYASLHKKSHKAIRHKMVDIGEKLLHSKEIIDNMVSVECEELLGIVVSILDMNGSYCCRCNKSLSRKEVLQCNGCHRMTYCSKECQKEDWLNGHKLACCKTYTFDNVGQFQGRVTPLITTQDDERALTKLKDLEVNSTMLHLKLFLDNSGTILAQVKGLGIPLYDCIVIFNLRDCPPTAVAKSYTDQLSTPELKKWFEETRSKENVTCVYFSHVFNREMNEEDDVPVLQMQRFFPHEWLTKQTKS